MARTPLADLPHNEQITRLTRTVTRLEARFVELHALIDQLDAWRHMWAGQLEDTIWGNIPKNARRRTVLKPDIKSVTDTVVAFMSSERPKITVLAENPGNMSQSELANFSERVGWALYDTVNRDRAESILMQSAEQVFHTGHLVTKSTWLSMEERGADYTEQPTGRYTTQTDENGIETDVEATERVVTSEHRFPLQADVMPTRDCLWDLNHYDEVIEFVYRYTATYAQLCSQFPDLEDHEQMKHKAYDDNRELEVWDYWTPTDNAIVIDKTILYKPATPHEFGCMPIVVELVKSRERRTANNGKQREGTPFCDGMLESIKSLSWAASMMSTYLEQTIYFIVKHKGLKDTSPYWTRSDDPDNPAKYTPVIGIGPGMQIWPLPEGEDTEIMQPPGISAPWLEYKQDRMRDSSLVSFNEGILTGVMPAGPSGYSVFQQTIATKARMEPYRIGLERGLSRTVQTWFKIIATQYDYAEGQSMKLTRILENRRYGTTQVELNAEDFKNIGMVTLQIDPKIRINNQEESALLMQAGQGGYASPYTVIDGLGFVADPEMELLRIEWFKFINSDHPLAQQAQMGAAKKYAQLQGLDIPWPEPPQPAAVPGMAQAGDPSQAMADPMAALMQDPQMAAMMGGQAPIPQQTPEQASAATLDSLMAANPVPNGVVR